jgi:hypothetical protein
MDVDLDAVGAHFEGATDRAEGILRFMAGSAAMTDAEQNVFFGCGLNRRGRGREERRLAVGRAGWTQMDMDKPFGQAQGEIRESLVQRSSGMDGRRFYRLFQARRSSPEMEP